MPRQVIIKLPKRFYKQSHIDRVLDLVMRYPRVGFTTYEMAHFCNVKPNSLASSVSLLLKRRKLRYIGESRYYYKRRTSRIRGWRVYMYNQGRSML